MTSRPSVEEARERIEKVLADAAATPRPQGEPTGGLWEQGTEARYQDVVINTDELRASAPHRERPGTSVTGNEVRREAVERLQRWVIWLDETDSHDWYPEWYSMSQIIADIYCVTDALSAPPDTPDTSNR